MENADIARVLSEIADILELTGGNAFKVRAYRQAAQVVDVHPGPVADLWRQGRLTDLPGIGEGIAGKIGELVDTGTCREQARLEALVPQGVLEMLRVEGVGPKTALAAWKQLGIADVAALEEACRSGRLLEAPRMGPARARSILAAIERHRARTGRMPLHRALEYAEAMLARLRRVPGALRAEAAGSLRRRKETVGDIDILVAASDAAPVVRAFAGLSEVAEVLAEGPTKASVRLRAGIAADLRVLPPESFGAALHYFTGSKAHNIALRTRAVKMGVKLSEYGVFDRRDRRLGGATEEEVFRAVGLPFIPPELREGAGEIEAAEQGRLPRLVEEEDLLGDLHVHSSASGDARSDLEELAGKARGLGRRYLAITDHSRSRPRGLDAARLAERSAAVRQLDARLGGRPHLLAGIEVDVLPSGALDLPGEALAALDLVVAGVHSRLGDPAEKMTERVVRALRSGLVHVLAHPTGRQIGAREASALDLARVLEAAREEGVALEVNAMPERLDLTDVGCRMAKEAGVPVAISSDAHNATHLANLRYGVWVARRGWLEARDVWNALPLEELRRRLARRPVRARGVGR
ncbi:MAG TPA: DNA polymerase/3'-5' exonuclease PolX [Anaeromyxobacteraceae bacterium]|nr:DNA polymerase/3'-5' exonuclease PolX [Anaeromyxobacteraceae bacterium]